MIEAYAFLGMFTVQILAMSVLHPTWFTRFTRAKLEFFYPDERFAQMYPGTERARVDRFLNRYRLANACIAVLGLLLLGWMFNYTQRPHWDDGPVKALTSSYFLLQVVPLVLVALIGSWSARKARGRLAPEAKRTASLQRRGLFDFVSPFMVLLAVLAYFLFAAYLMYIQAHPFPGFAGAFVNLAAVTLVYALNLFTVYLVLYGRKSNPLESRTDRARTTGIAVKVGVYTCIAVVAFMSLDFTLALLDLQRWEPFGLSVFLVVCALLCSMSLTAPARREEAAC